MPDARHILQLPTFCITCALSRCARWNIWHGLPWAARCQCCTTSLSPTHKHCLKALHASLDESLSILVWRGAVLSIASSALHGGSQRCGITAGLPR